MSNCYSTQHLVAMWLRSVSLLLATLIFCNQIYPQDAIEIPPVIKKQVKKLHVRCVKQTGTSEELVLQAHTGDLPDNPNFKCFLHCMFDMFGLVDSENVMHLDSLIEVVPEELHPNIRKLSDTCDRTGPGADGCETVYQAIKCYLRTDGPFVHNAVNELLG